MLLPASCHSWKVATAEASAAHIEIDWASLPDPGPLYLAQTLLPHQDFATDAPSIPLFTQPIWAKCIGPMLQGMLLSH